MSAVENPMVLGRIERYPAPRLVVVNPKESNDIDNPKYDVYGQFIAPNDDYFVLQNHVIHLENLGQYFEEHLKAKWKVKK